MREFRAIKFSLVASAVGMCLASPAQAQTASSPPADSSAIGQIDEIIVTARRREERLQDVPISITVFDQQQITDRNIVNAGDLATYTPSLTSNTRFGQENTSFAIRGFIQEGPTSPSVAVYFADVVGLRANGGTTAGNGAGPGSFFDLQNVQVLKGPQGTLFGRNTTGGAVLLVPQKPTGDLEGYLEATGGNYNQQRLQGVVNVPVGDSFRVRLGVDWNTRDGYLNNVALPGLPRVGPKDFNDVNYIAARLSAVWDITPNLENYTIASYSDSDTNGYVPKMYLVSAPNGYRGANYTQQVNALRGDFWDVSNGNPRAGQKIEQWQAINTTTWNLSDSMTLKNIVSYGEFQQAQASSIYGDNGVTAGSPIHYNDAVNITPAPGKFNVSQSTFTEELQLQGRIGAKFNYQTGVYYEYAEPIDGFQSTFSGIYLDCVDLLNLQCTDTRGRLTFIAPGVNLEGRIGSASLSRSQYWFRNRGVYAQGTFEFTDQFSMTAGLRYTSDDTTGLGQPLRANFPAANTPSFSCANPFPLTQGGTSAQIQADPTRCNISRHQSSDEPTWMIDFDYKPIDDLLVYAKYARGYRQGSVNVSSYGLETWGPEQVDTYEIGLKTSWDAAVSGLFNLAVFYNDFTDQQLQLGTVACTTISLPQCPFVPSPAAGIANAGKSEIKGVELEAVVNLFQGFKVDVGYTYLDSKIKTITLPPPPLGFTSLTTAAAGEPIPLTPESKYTVTLSYTLPMPESVGKVTLGATGSYQDKMLGAVSSIASGLYELPEQKLLNLNVNWESVAGLPLDIGLFATNVTEEEFWTFTSGASFGFDSLMVNEPRMYGARLKYKFGAN